MTHILSQGDVKHFTDLILTSIRGLRGPRHHTGRAGQAARGEAGAGTPSVGSPMAVCCPGKPGQCPAQLAAQGARACLTGCSDQQLRSPSFLPPHIHCSAALHAIPSFTHTLGEEYLLFVLSLPHFQGFPPVNLIPRAPPSLNDPQLLINATSALFCTNKPLFWVLWGWRRVVRRG